MAPVNPPQYLQAGIYSARSDRLVTAAHMTPQHGTGALAMRSGVRPTPSNAGLEVTQRTTPSMFVTVAAGIGWLQSSAATGGGYMVVNDAPYDVAITTSHATLGRRDLIVARVYDAEVAGSVSQWTLEVITGTPSGSPTAPTAPTGSMALATVLVGAATTTIVNGNITDARVYTTSLGGTTPAPASALPANPYRGMAAYDTTNLQPTWYNGTAWTAFPESLLTRCTLATRPASPVSGQRIWETDTGREMIYTGSTWAFYRGLDIFVFKAADESVVNSSTLQDDNHFINIPFEANATYLIRMVLVGNAQNSTNFHYTILRQTGTTPYFAWFTASPHSGIPDADHVTLSHNILGSYPNSSGSGADAQGFGADILYPNTLMIRSTTAGTFKLQWCQSALTASAAIIRAGSYIYGQRVA